MSQVPWPRAPKSLEFPEYWGCFVIRDESLVPIPEFMLMERDDLWAGGLDSFRMGGWSPEEANAQGEN